MTLTLTEADQSTLLTAYAEGTWNTEGAVRYEGDTSLLLLAPSRSAVCYLSGFFDDAARRHELKVGGDVMEQRSFGFLVEPH